MDERRKSERFELKLPVKLLTKDLNLTGLRTADISSLGAFVLTNEPFHAGSSVDISVYLPSMQKETVETRCMLKAKGTVIRAEINGIAVEFDRTCKISPFTDNKKTL